MASASGSPQTPLGPGQSRLCMSPPGDGPALSTSSASSRDRGMVRPRRSLPPAVESEATAACASLFGSAAAAPRSARPQGKGGEGLRRDLLAFFDRHDDALADLMVHVDEGAVLAHVAIVEARLPALLHSAEAADEDDPQPLVDDSCRRAATVRQVRISDLSRTTLVLLLRWAYGEAIPTLSDEEEDGKPELATRRAAFDLLEACAKYEVERLGTLLRETMIESLDLVHFASVLRESHKRQISGLKQGCMRFALHHFDTLVERPELFMHTLSDCPEVVSDLFRLGRKWKDAEGEGGRIAPGRPAPAVPSTIVGDFCRLFEAARLDEHGEEGASSREDSGDHPRPAPRHRGQQDFAPDCRVVVGEDMYLAHSAVLAARSDFFRAAFGSEMVERTSLMVTLQHCRGDRPRRESVLAMLYFLYTGKTTKVNGSNAIEVLSLLGLERGDDGESSGGFLQIHDSATLRRACETAAESAAGEDEDEIIKLLVQANDLGAVRLKQWALRMTVHHFKELALRGALEVLPGSLLTEVLREVAVGYDRLLPSAAKGLRWELSMLPQADNGLENTYEALTSADLSAGAGACGTSGNSEASLVATFSQPVRVRRIRVGVDLTNGDFEGASVNDAKLQFLASSGLWQDGDVTVIIRDRLVRDFELPEVLIAPAFRLVRRTRLAVGLLVFE